MSIELIPPTKQLCGKQNIIGQKWIGTSYIKINPSNKTYYYDIIYSNTVNKHLYIGFEKYDINKTSTSNNSCTYVLNTTSSAVEKRIFGTVNLSTDSAGTITDTIKLRILTCWDAADTTSITTIHYISLREVDNLQQTQIKKNGILSTNQFREYKNAQIFKNGFVESNAFYEF